MTLASSRSARRRSKACRPRGRGRLSRFPAGAIGNQAPIEMVTEQWFSPELGTVVLSRRSDPRFGETTYRLQNIVRAEPAADLFQVPSITRLKPCLRSAPRRS